MAILLGRTRWGPHTVATGGNFVGASESGINVRSVKVGNFKQYLTEPVDDIRSRRTTRHEIRAS